VADGEGALEPSKLESGTGKGILVAVTYKSNRKMDEMPARIMITATARLTRRLLRDSYVSHPSQAVCAASLAG